MAVGCHEHGGPSHYAGDLDSQSTLRPSSFTNGPRSPFPRVLAWDMCVQEFLGRYMQISYNVILINAGIISCLISVHKYAPRSGLVCALLIYTKFSTEPGSEFYREVCGLVLY